MRCSHAVDEKRLLRMGVCTARASRPAVDRAADGARLASYAADLIALATATEKGETPTIAAYAGVAEEPPTRDLLDALIAQGATVLLPVVTGPDEPLDWARYDGWDALTDAKWGLREPTTQRLGPTAVDDADLVVVPALAVDDDGHRLGRGRGFYDRSLANVDVRRRVAVVYATELLTDIPSEPHDQRVGWALTPDGLTRLAQ